MSKGADAALAALEQRLGYSFSDRTLLVTALTHASAANSGTPNYQRLEFLGDRVLGLAIAELLYAAFPKASEGELSPQLAALVRKETCAEVATALQLGSHIAVNLGKPGRAVVLNKNILGDVAEAVIAAIYLDGGWDAARRFVTANWNERVRAGANARRDPKSVLQEWAQSRGLPTPSYTIVDRTGPAHASLFTVEVAVNSLRGQGDGRTRREAEQEAAAAVLVREGVWADARGV